MTETESPQTNPFAQPRPWDLVAGGYAEHLYPHLARYSADALRLANLRPGEAALDVATGPGTLALQAADITRVDAIDFSAPMLAQLRDRATAAQRANLTTREGDGQALPYEDRSFDAAFSMFGLFLFDDRAKGFSELARVLRPGGRAAVASWQPQEKIPAFGALYSAMAELSPTKGPPREGPAPLSLREDFEREMSAAGFDVEIVEAVHAIEAPSMDALWAVLERSHVALTLMADALGPERYRELSAALRARMGEALGEGPQRVAMPAWIALGRI